KPLQGIFFRYFHCFLQLMVLKTSSSLQDTLSNFNLHHIAFGRIMLEFFSEFITVRPVRFNHHGLQHFLFSWPWKEVPPERQKRQTEGSREATSQLLQRCP